MAEERHPAIPEEEAPLTPLETSPDESDAVPIPPEILESLPVGVRRRVLSSFSATLSGRLPNPLLDKLNAEHISSLISLADKDRDRALEDRKHSRKWLAAILALFVIPVAVLLGYFAFLQQNTLVAEIIKLAAVGLGGFGGGYGVAKWRGSR